MRRPAHLGELGVLCLMDIMLALYKSFILPHLEYCSPFLLGVGKVQANKIEDANDYILRTLTGHGKSLYYQELLNIFKLGHHSKVILKIGKEGKEGETIQ